MLADFIEWFERTTTHSTAHPWQVALGSELSCRSRLVRVPTGFGKTHGALAAWSYHRIHRNDNSWPRRLVWCLPMRSLVEQTAETAHQMFARLPEDIRPEVFVLMGGVDSGPWHLYPDRPAVLIGTQDMLLSRALNRGYVCSRARWPVEFGLLNQDALWVLDEVQLMDVGLTTATHLQAFREQDEAKQLRPAFTWWMSATLQPAWLHTVDTEAFVTRWFESPCVIEPAHRQGGLWDSSKRLVREKVPSQDSAGFAELILRHHEMVPAGEWGKLTLVVCNTVQRACETHEALRRKGRLDGLELVHSRFRGAERSGWRAGFLTPGSCRAGVDRILVATQVIEAGVDLSAGCLVTELAPWPSLVQRFGRCARFGGKGQVVVVDRQLDERTSGPYSLEDLEVAGESLSLLDDAGISRLEGFEEALGSERRARLYRYQASQLLLRQEFDELFDTTPDLTGADLDISRFLRSGPERDLYLFWDRVEGDEQPAVERSPDSAELCAVPYMVVRDWLCGPASKSKSRPGLLKGKRAWVWDWIDGKWVTASRSQLLPGRVVCVSADTGGYDLKVGFSVNSRTEVRPPAPSLAISGLSALEAADSREDAEDLSQSAWQTIAEHSNEVSRVAMEIADLLALPREMARLLEIAGHWHDCGKSHPAFQGSIRSNDRPLGSDVAKAPNSAWVGRAAMYQYADNSDQRHGFRHELASALAMFAALERYAPMHDALLGRWAESCDAMGWPDRSMPGAAAAEGPLRRLISLRSIEFDLVAYLVASHHGKVRVSLQAGPKDQEYRDKDGRGLPIRGVREGDRLPSFDLVAGEERLPELVLTVEPAAMGLSIRTGASWQDRCAGLLSEFGPASLGLLEAIFRAADVRASQIAVSRTTTRGGSVA